jgi:calcium/proton exchanger cax
MKVIRWLLLFFPVAIAAEYLHWGELAIFVTAALAIIPIAGVLGEATEALAAKTGPQIGGLLNASLGNAAELIITLVAIRAGSIELVRASIIGSILGNLLFVLGLMLVCLRALSPNLHWREGWLRTAFWAMNGGLMLMCVGSLLPVGLAQTWASVDQGYWYARSTEFLGTPLMQTLRWMRAPGDTIFAAGALILVGFVFAGRKRTA